VALREKVEIDPTQVGRGCAVTARLKDGRTLTRIGDVSQPMRDLPAQQAKIERKFRHLAVPAIGEGATERVIAILGDLERQPDVRTLMSICAGAPA